MLEVVGMGRDLPASCFYLLLNVLLHCALVAYVEVVNDAIYVCTKFEKNGWLTNSCSKACGYKGITMSVRDGMVLEKRVCMQQIWEVSHSWQACLLGHLVPLLRRVPAQLNLTQA